MPPDTFLLTIDSLRKDVVTRSGDQSLTPHLDTFAAEAIQFENAFAQGPYTATSFPAILCGTFMVNYHQEDFELAEGSLAMAMRNQGYATAGFHTNPYISSAYGYDSGFDKFEEFASEAVEARPLLRKVKQVVQRNKPLSRVMRHAYMAYNYGRGNKPYLDGERILHEAASWAREQNSPVFAWTHLMDAHYPYMPDDEHCERSLSRWRQAKVMSAIKRGKEVSSSAREDARMLYNASVRTVDDRIGTFFDHLKAQGRYDDALIIVTSDHGEEFGEHGGYLHEPKLYDELISVPLLVKPPASNSRLENGFVEHRDIEDIVTAGVQGEEISGSRNHIVSGCAVRQGATKQQSVAIRDSAEKLIVHEGRENELYNLEVDPQEEQNQYAGSHRFEDIADQYLEGNKRTNDREMDEQTRQRLEALGYL